MKKKIIPILVVLPFLSALIVNPFGINYYELGKQTYLAIFLSLVIISYILKFLSKEKAKIEWNSTVMIFLLFWIFSLIMSTILSTAPEKSFFGDYSRLGGTISQFLYITYFLVIINLIKEKKHLEEIFKYIIGIGLIIAVHSILQKFNLLLFFSKSELVSAGFLGRSFSTLGNPNLLGQFLIFPIFATIYFLIKNKKKLIPSIILPLMILGMAFTENRASLLAVVAGIFILFFFSKKIRTRLKILIAILCTVSLGAFILHFAPTLRSLETRFYLWNGASTIFINNPVFGTGLETFDQEFQKVLNPGIYNSESLYSIADRAHNEFLDIEMSLGIFGFSIYLGAILTIIILYLFHKRKDSLLNISFASFIALLVSNFFGFSLTVHFLTFYLLIAILLKQLIKFEKQKLILSPKVIFQIAAILLFTLYISFTYIRNFTADLYFFNAKTTAQSPYDSLTKAVSLNPHQSRINYYLAFFLSANGQPYSIALENAGRFDNYNFNYFLNKAKLELENEDIEEAQISLDQASLLAPNNGEILMLKGKTFMKTGNYNSAIETFEYLLKIAPKYATYNANEIKRDRIGYETFLNTTPDFLEIFDYLIEAKNKLDQ